MGGICWCCIYLGDDSARQQPAGMGICVSSHPNHTNMGRENTMKELPERGVGWRKEHWFSICSMHQKHDKTCSMCNAGTWTPVWRIKLSNGVYAWWPELWRWWVNNIYPKGLQIEDYEDFNPPKHDTPFKK